MKYPIASILQFFRYDHLPKHLQTVSQPFHTLATQIAHGATEPNPEHTVALRKLLEAKDAAVRAAMWESPTLQIEGEE